jgi:hypothetical protein
MATCARCAATGEKLKTAACIACGLEVCEDCRGDEGGGYWNLGGKKGVACSDCIRSGTAFEGGGLSQAREFYARVHNLLLPEAGKAVDARIDRALVRIETLTNATLKDAEGTVERLVGRLETAIATQRTGARGDADLVLKNLKGTVIWAAVILALINLTGIAAAVLAAHVLK